MNESQLGRMERNTPLSRVAAWHARFQVAIPSVPTFDPDTVALRIRLLIEERDELIQAINDRSRVDQLDALCDLQYVLSGAVLHLGLREAYTANGGSSPFVWSAPQNIVDSLDLAARCIVFGIKVNQLARICASDNASAIRLGVSILTDCQNLLNGLIAALGFADVFDAAFVRVDENNHGKMWSEEDVDLYQSAVRDTIPKEEWLRFIDPNPNWGPGWGPKLYIAKDNGGKIHKPVGFKKVSLEEFCK